MRISLGHRLRAAVLGISAALAPPAAAMSDELGVDYASRSGFFQLHWAPSLGVAGFTTNRGYGSLTRSEEPFGVATARSNLDVYLGDHLYVGLDLIADRGDVPNPGDPDARVLQGFVRFLPLEDVDLGVQAGKFVTPFGAYPQRHGGPEDAFITAPLPFDRPTVLGSRKTPGGAKGFATWPKDDAKFRAEGSPPLWGVPYQNGVMLSGSGSWGRARLAAMNSALASPPPAWDLDLKQGRAPSLVAHVSAFLLPSLTLGLSHAAGPYLDQNAEGLLPGDKANEHKQVMNGVNLSFKRGRVSVFAEAFHDEWQTPHLEKSPTEVSYYVETKVKLVAGTFFGLRLAAMRFGEVDDENGEPRRWDEDVDQGQVALGALINRHLELKAEYGVERVKRSETTIGEAAAAAVVYRL